MLFAEYELNIFRDSEKDKKNGIYISYISNNLSFFKSIDTLIKTHIVRFYKISLNTFLEHNINTKIIEIDKLTKNFNDYYTKIIKDSIYELITYNKFTEENVEEKLNELVDFNYIQNPSLLLNEEELKKYAEAMFKWNKYVYKEIKNKLQIEYQPPLLELFIKKLEEYVMSFEEDKPDVKKEEIKIQPPIEKQIDYPLYIFANQKSYILFNTIAEKLENHSEISFLFRKMSENIKPPLIICSIKQFIDWFNTQNYNLKMDYTPKTYLQSYNSERNAYFEIIKSFIISN